MGYLVEGYWDCTSCNTKGIKGHLRECPNCGKPRGEHVKFYTKEIGEDHAVKDEDIIQKTEQPDWICEYCGGYNNYLREECSSCGSPKPANGEIKTYFDLRKEVNRRLLRDENHNGIDDEEEISDEERDRKNLKREMEDREQKRREASQKYHSNNKKMNEEIRKNENKNKNKSSLMNKIFNKKGIGVFGILLAIGLMVYYFMIPKVDTITIQHTLWERSIPIERYATIEESDWSVPPGGREYKQEIEVRSYTKVLDHYDIEHETIEEKVQDGYTTKKYKKDKGNGYFEIEEEKVPKYKTVKKKVEKKVPVYREDPVYDTKHYYQIERWIKTRDVKTSGKDDEPYWGNITLKDGSEPYGAGKERIKESYMREQYSVEASNSDGDTDIYPVDDFQFWSNLHIGDSIKVEINRTNNTITPAK